MDLVELEQVVRNVDARVARIEQILPTLATKEDLKTFATKEELRTAIAPLATKEELRAAVAPLATKEELRSLGAELREEIREEGDRSRRHMDVITESLRGDIHLIAEHVASGMSKRTGA